MNNIEKIKNSVIKKGFPELISEEIQIEYKKLDDAVFEYGELEGGGFYIEVDETMKNAPLNAVKGGFAHEFSHIINDHNPINKEKISDKIAYKISEKFKSLDERNADLQAIIRGFGKEMADFLRFCDKNGFPHYKNEGLSLNEIEKLVNNKS